MCHCSGVPFHSPLGSWPRPAAAAAPPLRWWRVELVPGLELLEERTRRLQGERGRAEESIVGSGKKKKKKKLLVLFLLRLGHFSWWPGVSTALAGIAQLCQCPEQ